MNTEWLEDAECTRRDPELFYAAENGVHGAALVVAENAAKATCERCGVQEDCLLYALATQQRHGIWGGLTAPERDELLARGRETA